jgi:hypothetical protein
MTNLLHIAIVCLNTTNARIQIESTDHSNYYTNFGGTNTHIIVNSQGSYNAFAGCIGELSWAPTTSITYIQCSTDLITWKEIPVALVGTTNWYVNPQIPTFYRLRLGGEKPPITTLTSSAIRAKSLSTKVAAATVTTSSDVTVTIRKPTIVDNDPNYPILNVWMQNSSGVIFRLENSPNGIDWIPYASCYSGMDVPAYKQGLYRAYILQN